MVTQQKQPVNHSKPVIPYFVLINEHAVLQKTFKLHIEIMNLFAEGINHVKSKDI